MIDWTPGPIAIQIGPLPLYWYGIAYALGLLAVYLVVVRLAERAGQNPEHVTNGMIVIGIAALVGGRLYHVIDQWQLYSGDPIKIVLPPYTGLGVYGGIITGLVAFAYLIRRWRLDLWVWADMVPVGIFVMQAVGRLGNFFNQELYGPPTELPWGIAIDCAHRVAPYLCPEGSLPTATLGQHFTPLFLYESLSGVLGAAVLVWLGSRPRPFLRRGDLLGMGLIWYAVVRFVLESMRTGNWRLEGVPTAQIFSVGFAVFGLAVILYRHLTASADEIVRPLPRAEAEAEDETAGEAEPGPPQPGT